METFHFPEIHVRLASNQIKTVHLVPLLSVMLSVMLVVGTFIVQHG